MTLIAPMNPCMTQNDMTAATPPTSFVASASSELGVGAKAFDAFQIIPSPSGDCWTTNFVPTGWLQLDMGSAAQIVGCLLMCSNNVTRAPNTFTLLGSNTGSFSGEEVTLLSKSGETSWSSGEVRSYSATSPGSYRYVRLNVTANDGDAVLLKLAAMFILISPSAGGGSSVIIIEDE